MRSFSHWSKPAFRLPVELIFLLLLMLPLMLGLRAAAGRGLTPTLLFWLFWIIPLGTFGAFIQIKSLIKSRRAVFDIGIAGPLAGLAVAIPLLYVGLRDSVPVSTLPPGAAAYSEPSLLLALMYQLVHGSDQTRVVVWLSPVALAAWIGISVTALNLLPVGQLDGGHIAYALVGSRHARHVGSTAYRDNETSQVRGVVPSSPGHARPSSRW